MKILIANRGEIAVRIMRTARRLGHGTVAVYSAADRDALHVEFADEAVPIGPAPSAESYLAIDKLVAAARATAATAVHPGYGFLAENAAFARACGEAGLVFIGPPPRAIELMGDKRAAKQAMKAAGVPCIPGYEGADQSEEAFTSAAERIGFPVMVKAAAGGGGRGMRRVAALGELGEALRSARAEAQSAFGDGTLLLEKALDGARHVEVQVLADTHGRVIHLGERDCSVQRRHQKVLEECPSPAVDDDLRRRMGEAAVLAAKASDYVGAGTVELLLDDAGAFYFLEMNTRLQVEHPVTEAVTGIDLVEEQLRVAEGEPLGIHQDDVTWDGHAIEARLYAEDPSRGFLPQTGRLLTWQPPETIRVDAGVREGSVVSPHYDPMIAKLVAYGQTRREALRRLTSALRATRALGVVTNKEFLLAVCEHAVFASGDATTAFIGAELSSHPCLGSAPPSGSIIAAAAMIVVLAGARGLAEDPTLVGWRSGGPIWSAVTLEHGDVSVATRVLARGASTFAVSWGEHEVVVEVVADEPKRLVLLQDGVRRAIDYAIDGTTLWLDDGEGARVLEDVTHRAAQAEGGVGSGRLVAPLDGAVTEVCCTVGDRVERGQLLLVLEAMKMEHRIVADVDGMVETLAASVGQQVKTRQLLAQIVRVAP